MPEGDERATQADLGAAKELTEERIKRLDDALDHIRELGTSQRTADKLAVETALTSAKELSEAHNGLLRKMELQTEKFATREEVDRLRAWQARATGIGIALGAGVLANVIKLWTG
jgi:hypothetical protein